MRRLKLKKKKEFSWIYWSNKIILIEIKYAWMINKNDIFLPYTKGNQLKFGDKKFKLFWEK